MNKIVKGNYFGEAAMLLVTLLWGGTFAIIKEALDDVSSMLFIALRFSMAAILLLPLIYKYRKQFTREVVRAGLVIGLLLFAGFATQTIGLKFTSATKSGFLTGSAVVMVPFLQTMIERKRPTTGSIVGVVVVFIGILLLSSGGESVFAIFSEFGRNFNFGDFMTLLCAVFFALYIIYLDVFTKRYEFWLLVILQIYTMAVMAHIFSLGADWSGLEPTRIDFTFVLIFGLLYTSLFTTLFTTTVQTKYQKLISPTKASIIFSFEPVFAAIFAFFLLNEKITNLGYIGAALIFTGLIISEILDNFLKKNE